LAREEKGLENKILRKHLMNSRDVWFTGCLVALALLIRPHPKGVPLGHLVKAYGLYLLFHIGSNIPVEGISADYKSALTGFGGSTYLVVACLIWCGGGRNLTEGQASLVSRSIKFAAGCSSILLVLVLSIPKDSIIIVVFCFYMFYSIVAFIVVFKEVRHARKGPQDVRISLAIAATFGMIDFLLPVIPFLGADVGGADLDFLSRLFDCVLYLPFMVFAVRGYDIQSGGTLVNQGI